MWVVTENHWMQMFVVDDFFFYQLSSAFSRQPFRFCCMLSQLCDRLNLTTHHESLNLELRLYDPLRGLFQSELL
jgi:hypothetical protein